MNQPAETSEPSHEIDLSGLTCPLPILKTKAALARLGSGELLKVVITNPDSVREFGVLCKSPSFELESLEETGTSWIYRIRKG